MGDRRLVRARVKAVEDLPDWAHCCENFLEYQADTQKEELFILETETRGNERSCSWCNNPLPPGIDALLDGYPDGVNKYAIELLDLDEGPNET